MTDSEIAVAVAKRCGIPFEATSEGWPLLVGLRDVGRVGRHIGPFDPANNWNDAMTALKVIMEPMLLSRRHKLYGAIQEELAMEGGAVPAWPDAFSMLVRHGPRAICAAILALPDVTI